MLHYLLAPSLPEKHSNKEANKPNNLLAQQQEKPESKKIHLPLKFDQFGSAETISQYHSFSSNEIKSGTHKKETEMIHKEKYIRPQPETDKQKGRKTNDTPQVLLEKRKRDKIKQWPYFPWWNSFLLCTHISLQLQCCSGCQELELASSNSNVLEGQHLKKLSTVLLVSWCLLPMTKVLFTSFFGGHNQPTLSICFGIRSRRNQVKFFPRALCLPLG
ncbi:hypothetical protein CDAR_105481 [Caerostris darwini]|uniref:Uncharacterized protein n=1 Tax=Caerostris darwini TaxID=1538125 RepID=A0AAV4MZS9_9ARAC|nr:hypothetical protein CDAR_105481 [Caerostris darwini]